MSFKINNNKHPVILFIPEVGIYPYARGLAILGDAITKCGGRVYITHDTGQMLRSPIMAMYGTSTKLSIKEKNKISKVTEKYYKYILKKYNFSSIELSDFVDNRSIKEINSLVNGTGGNLKRIYYKGFPVGRMAEFDFILETKFPYYSKLSATHKELYIQYIKNTALTISIVDKICERYKPSLILTFNEYAQCQAARYSAKTHKVRRMTLTYPVNLNIDASRFLIWESTYRYWMANHCQKWKIWEDTPVQRKYIKASWDDAIFRMYKSGSHIFSSRKKNNSTSIFKQLDLDPKRKTVVVYTSSQEERSCSELSMNIWKEKNLAVDAFKNQIDWLLYLRDYASKRNDLQIVVRVHPREGSRQFGFESQHLRKLKSTFKKDTSNFIIVWPDDPISSYDLMELADICLIAWSTIGQEAARLGIPVLTYISNIYYPDADFVQVATTRKEYEKKLDSMLQMKYTWQHLIRAVRFYHWRTFIPSLDLGKTVPTDFDDGTIWPKASKPMVQVINDVLAGRQDLIKYNIKKWHNSLSADTAYQEKEAMKLGIRNFLDKLFFPPNSRFDLLFRVWRYVGRRITSDNLWTPPERDFRDYHLKFSEETSRLRDFVKITRNNQRIRFVIASGSEAILVHNGKMLHRISPVVVRLARLHEYS